MPYDEPAGLIHDDPGEVLTYRFGQYLLDVPHRRLFSGIDVKTLPEKPFQLLLLLLEADRKVVARRTFFERLWPNDPVGDANLTQHIFLLRGILGEHGRDNEYIITVSGKGYRFAKAIERKSGLSMKESCEGCGRGLQASDEAFICTYECTFCRECSDRLNRKCPNCGGEQAARPRR